ncbi:3-hydroxyacyl-CoA dehydrogenase family protein [Rhodococcus sp. MTM3W5.2]|uniref:3-hydroxyacyl-CoA dehydrogenase family protein n=1 Tax=Rhodococcus sp. MTM3W5.2 TaxID=1805827 RepID=UPI00097C48C3|nr:3-hydroxyacyl-CoA dehydrogenase family protein [Rhodococcus sp. MTM3W5.2]
MGSGIAAMAAGHGLPVLLVDLDQYVLTQTRSRIDQHLRHAQLLSALPADRAPAAVRTTTSIHDTEGAIAVIEAITEQVDLKRLALTEVSQVIAPGTPLVSNTSGIPIDELAEGLPRSADLAGIHFMNPAYLINTVEVIQGPRTAPEIMAAVMRLLEELDRRVIVVQDAPGFVTSRLLHPMLNDAARIVSAGIASVEATDLLMQDCLGHPTGPLRTADLIGLDNLADSLTALYERTGEERFRPCELLLDKVEKGQLGRKSGQGFYKYGGDFS